MRTTTDAAGRDGRLEIGPVPTPMRLVDEADGVVAVADTAWSAPS